MPIFVSNSIKLLVEVLLDSDFFSRMLGFLPLNRTFVSDTYIEMIVFNFEIELLCLEILS